MAEDKTGKVLGVINEIPFGDIIGGPLSACITAQADAAQAALDYVKMASMKKESTLGKDVLEPETVSFTFVVDGQKRMLVVPLLTILPVPFIRIEHVDISFTADIRACRQITEESESKTEIKAASDTETKAYPKTRLLARYTAPNRNTKTEMSGKSESGIEVENLMEVDIHAVTSEMPAGLGRLLEVFNTQLIQVDQLSEKTVERLRKRNAGYVPVQPVDPKKPRPPRHHATEEQKKLLRRAYVAAIEASDENLARRIRNEILLTHKVYDAKTFLRATDQQYKSAPFLIRISSGLVDHPDCEYIPILSIEDNIAEQQRRQRKERKKLRADLIFALMTAKKMFPDGVKTEVGAKILQRAWNARTHRVQGWYTYGGAKAFPAFKDYVNSVIDAETARREAVAKGGKTIQPDADPEKVKALYDILRLLDAQMLLEMGIVIEGTETSKPSKAPKSPTTAKNPKKAARAASKATRQAKEAEDTAAKIAAEQKDKETKEAKAKDKAKDHAKVAATQAKKTAKTVKKKASTAAKKKASTTEVAKDE